MGGMGIPGIDSNISGYLHCIYTGSRGNIIPKNNLTNRKFKMVVLCELQPLTGRI
jgi:hypothetical protein